MAQDERLTKSAMEAAAEEFRQKLASGQWILVAPDGMMWSGEDPLRLAVLASQDKAIERGAVFPALGGG
jgi:hypothetical protein